MIGEYIAGCRILRVIGHGAQGVVYAALHPELSGEVAIKVLPRSDARDDAIVQRFLEVARTLMSLSAPGVVRVHDYGRDEAGRAYMVMERLTGETLHQRLRRRPPTLDETVELARQIAVTLDALHSSPDGQLVHRDIKPENIILVSEANTIRVVLVDFDIAKLAGSAATLSGMGALGSPPYMSPEQWLGDSRVDHRTDLYALGCLLYEMIAGTPPHGFGTTEELLRAHCELEPPSLLDSDPTIPAELALLVARLLAKDPEQRPASCREVLEVLDALALGGARMQTTMAQRTLVESGAPRRSSSSGWKERAYARLLEIPTWMVVGGAWAVGAALIGASIVLGVGDSYLSSPNWGFTYLVVVPLMAGLMARLVRKCDSALRKKGVGLAGEVKRLGAWMVGLTTLVVIPLSLVSCIAELIERAENQPIPGTFWTDSRAMGLMGSVAQALVVASLIAFVIHGVAWSQLVSPHVRTGKIRIDAFQGLLETTFRVGFLAQVALYLSNVQHIREVQGLPLGQLLVPKLTLDGRGGLFDMGTGLYPSLTTWLASAMILASFGATLVALRRIGRELVCAIALFLGVVFFRLGPVFFAFVLACEIERVVRVQPSRPSRPGETRNAAS